jgi:uncharacterized protein YecE (DUF72 family)
VVRIGTSGWTYRHWKEVFYPSRLPQKQWLEFYTTHFDTVEVNASFYHLPVVKTFTNWRERVPEGFCFTVKAPRQITHWQRLIRPESQLSMFFERVEQLGEKVGPLLFQYPPRWPVNPELLKGFLTLLPAGYRYVFEFRDASWLKSIVYDILHQHNVALCRSSSPFFPDADVETADFSYLRMHGGASWNYTDKELTMWAEKIRDWRSRGRDCYVYFNNDAYGYAVKNARTINRMIGEERLF